MPFVPAHGVIYRPIDASRNGDGAILFGNDVLAVQNTACPGIQPRWLNNLPMLPLSKRARSLLLPAIKTANNVKLLVR